MGDSSDSQDNPDDNTAQPKQGFNDLPVEYGTMLILCLYNVCTMPPLYTIYVLFLYELHTMLNTNLVLFLCNGSTILFHTMPVQSVYNVYTIQFLL